VVVDIIVVLSGVDSLVLFLLSEERPSALRLDSQGVLKFHGPVR